jgi:elongation factor Tu
VYFCIYFFLSKKLKLKYERTKPHCNIGTIGHVDHGKTTLTAAITRCLQGIGGTVFKAYSDIDNQVEEIRRGITINAAHVEYETVKRHYSHIDCPGHQQYVKNMLTGAVQMEGAILVVSVNDGPQVQTREHVILAKEVGIKYMVVFINKLDSLQESEMKELVELEVRELLESYGYPADLPVVKGSARLALEEDLQKPSELGMLAVKKLMDVVDDYIKQPDRLKDVPFLLSIEQTYVITGRGTVVTGKIEQGVVKLNDSLEIVGNDKRREVISTLCSGLEMFRKSMDVAEVGDNVGVLIKGVKKDEVRRGFILAAPGFIKPFKKFIAAVYILSTAEGGRKKPFVNNFKPQFFFRTANVTGIITLPLEVTMVMPGDKLSFTVELIEYCPLNVGLRFVFRESHATIGAGVITSLVDDD